MTCAVVCCMAAKRADVIFFTRWAWFPDVLHCVLVETRGVCEVLYVIDTFRCTVLTLGCCAAMEDGALVLCIYSTSWTTHVIIRVWSYSL